MPNTEQQKKHFEALLSVTRAVPDAGEYQAVWPRYRVQFAQYGHCLA